MTIRCGYDSLYKIFELIYNNSEKLRDGHISSLCALCVRTGVFAPLTAKLHDLQWELYKTTRDASSSDGVGQGFKVQSGLSPRIVRLG